MYLIFSTTATRKPLSYEAPYSDRFNWPKMLHISWLVLGEDLKPIDDFNAHIKPEGYTVSDEILENAHIKREDLENGQYLKDVLIQFETSVQKSKYAFAHNLKFNESVLMASMYGVDIHSQFNALDNYCLMEEGTYFCRIPSKHGGFKWPSLQELHTKLFNQKYSPTHNARADAITTAKCFIGLKKLRILDDIFE